MTCDERRDLMLPYAADLLEEGQQQEIRAHLASGCQQCKAALAEAQAMLEQIPASIDPVAPPADAVGRLMQRVKTENAQSAMRGTSFLRLAVAACLGAIVGGAIVFMVKQQQENQLRFEIAKANETLLSQQLKLVELTSGNQSPASGKVFWDQRTNRWHVVVFDLKPPAPGRTWELWFIKPDQTKIAAVMFNTDAQGNASITVPLPPDIGQIAVAAITDEPIGPLQPQPTGSVHLSGAVQ